MPTRHLSTKSERKGWKDTQSKVKRSRRTKLALGVLGLVVGLLVISWAVHFTQSLFSPWKDSASIHKNYSWNGEFNINLLLRTERISILVYNPKEEKIVIIDIPDETFLEVPHGFGSWQLRAVYELGESQKGIGGYKLLVDTLTSFLAVPIDGFLDFSALSPNKSAAEIVDTLKENPLSGVNFLSALKTNLTIWELLRLKLGISSVRFDKVKELDLNKLNVLDKEKLSDGTSIFTGDPVKLDSVLSDLADPTIISEHKSIAVFNATDQPQLAVKWARLITNLGGNVIITANGEKVNKTQVKGLPSATLKRLRQIFGADSNQDATSSRAQINLLLGEDYVNR